MRIEDFGGARWVETREELIRALSERHGTGVNECWMSGSMTHPALSLQVNESAAVLHYVPHPDHPGFLSVGDPEATGDALFYTNSPTEEIWVPKTAVVPIHIAIKAAEEFLDSQELPSCLTWEEL